MLLGLAAFIGLFSFGFQLLWPRENTIVAPWQTGLFVAALALGTSHAVESAALARYRIGKTWGTFWASCYAHGYFWGGAMFLIQAQTTSLAIDWVIWCFAAILFNLFLSALANDKRLAALDAYYETEHVLDRSGYKRFSFLVLPFVTLILLTALVLAPKGPLGGTFLATQIVVFGCLWPLVYEPTQETMRHRDVLLGIALVLTIVALFGGRLGLAA